jgi:hypothetical protein
VSALGPSLPMHSASVPINVRYASPNWDIEWGHSLDNSAEKFSNRGG